MNEKGIRENAKALKEAFAWNKGFKEFFCSKGNSKSISDPDSSGVWLRLRLLFYDRAYDGKSPWLLKEGDIMFSSMTRRKKNSVMRMKLEESSIWMISLTLRLWNVLQEEFQKQSAAVTIREVCLRSVMILWIIPEIPNME